MSITRWGSPRFLVILDADDLMDFSTVLINPFVARFVDFEDADL